MWLTGFRGRALECILGAAGAGKTTLMRTARVAYEGQGLVVAGAATAAVAVQELVARAGKTGVAT